MDIFELLHQDAVWQTRDEGVVRLEDMSPDHRRNTLALLRRWAPVGADRAHFAYSMHLLLSMRGSEAAEMAGEMLERGLEAESDEIHEDPSRWLEGTALVTRLRAMCEEAALAGAGHEWWEGDSDA